MFHKTLLLNFKDFISCFECSSPSLRGKTPFPVNKECFSVCLWLILNLLSKVKRSPGVTLSSIIVQDVRGFVLYILFQPSIYLLFKKIIRIKGQLLNVLLFLVLKHFAVLRGHIVYRVYSTVLNNDTDMFFKFQLWIISNAK